MQMVFIGVASKCTLMSNKPQADIETIYPGRSSRSRHLATNQDSAMGTKLRIRYSRQQMTIEISRFIPSEESHPKGGEWSKKILSTAQGLSQIYDHSWNNLDATEHSAMLDLRKFLRMCEFLEQLPPSGPALQSHHVNGTSSRRKQEVDPEISACTTKISTRSPVLELTKLSEHLTSKNSIVEKSTNQDILNVTSNSKPQSQSLASRSQTLPLWNPDEFSDEVPLGDGGIQTRFLPSVGWCMRYGSLVSQGGRYRIMFLDGVTLEIDVDEEYAEFKSLSGDVTRHKIGEAPSKRKVGERMKIFQEFVSLFEDSDQ
ncbi:hypothetical protein HWV62_45651 [Athelia sp. TMB]|nr:hypothetical protein HWV62_45651 [Athelia sp. TMB]